MRKCYSLIAFAIAAGSLVAPQSAFAQAANAQCVRARSGESVAKLYAQKEVSVSRVNVATETRKAGATSKLAKERTGSVSPFVASGATAAFKASASSVLYGSVIYNGNWSSMDEAGIYSMPVGGTPAFTEVAVAAGLNANSGGCLVEDKYISTVKTSILGIITVYTHYVYDATTWELLSSVSGSQQSSALDLTYDATTGLVYGCFVNDAANGYCFGSLDPETFVRTAIADLENPFQGIAAAPDGTIYGITTAGKLYTVNKTTGATTLVGDTGLQTQYLVSATCDPVSGTLYYSLAPADETGWLYTIDKTTAQATAVYQFPGDAEVTGLFIPAPAAEDKAPAATSEVVLDFSEGSLTGHVKFTAPISLYDGTAVAAGTAGLTYKILANGVEVASAATTYGANVDAEVTLPTAGQYTFTVTVANEVGSSPKQTAKMFVGNDVPKAPANVALVYADGKMQLTWDAVTASVNGGYVNPAAITYTVTRLTDNVVVAEGISATSFEEAVAMPENYVVYRYSVQAVYSTLASAVVNSNSIALGDIIPPYTNTFDDGSALDGYTIIDANGDGKKWTISDGAVRVAYNTSMAMDDWMITPAIKLTAGKAYKFSIDARANGTTYPEKVEVKMGNAATAEAMTTSLVAATTLTSSTYQTLTAMIIPETDGIYYVGVHGISDADEYYLYVDNLSIGAAMSTAAPGVATALAVTPDPTGALKANFTFTTPDITIGGSALTSLTKVEVYNGETLLETIDAPAPGVIIEKSYDNLTRGVNTFGVVAYNAEGSGEMATAQAFVGINVPATPTNVNVVEISPVGTVQVTWTAPTADVDGKPLDASELTYIVAEYQSSGWVPVSENITGYSFDYAAVPAGEQDFVQFAVFAQNGAGMGSGTASGMIAAGTPYTLPFAESFAEGNLNYIWGTQRISGNGSWSIAADGEDFSDVTSQDADGGFAYFKGSNVNDSGALFTGKITVSGTNPGLSFYYMPLGDDDTNEIIVKSKDSEGNESTLITVPQTGEMGVWKKATVNIKELVGKTAQFYFQVVTKMYSYTFLDNIRIAELVDNNLSAEGLTAPAAVVGGESFTVPVTVQNNGILDASGYSVSLYCDGEVVETKDNLPALASFASTTVDFTVVTTPMMAGEHTYYAVINYAADQDLTDNTTATVTVNVKANSYPVATLSGELDANGDAKLSWTAPDLSTAGPVEFTETFEDPSYESFTTESFGPWTLKNFNTSNTYGISNATFPGAKSPFGYILMDAEAAGLNAAYGGYGGSASFDDNTGRSVQAFAHQEGANDAWLISPLLTGDAQTVTFYACALNLQYGPETFEVLYSTTDQEIASFQVVNVNGAASADAQLQWDLYTVELPAGAKYFAIRSTATDTFVLSVDNITFKGYVDANAGLEVMGYNIYRDGVKLNDAPVTETSYNDYTAPAGAHTYVVTVVYNRGESKASNEVLLTTSGVDAIDADAAAVVTVEAQSIVVTNADGAQVVVVAADGKVVYNAAGQSRTVVAVAPGVYVVKVAAKVVKVVVK